MNGFYLEERLGSMKYREYLVAGEGERKAHRRNSIQWVEKGRQNIKALRLSLQRLGLF